MVYRAYGYDALCAELERDELRRNKMYQDSEGIETIGIGWNLREHGLPEEQINALRDISIEWAEAALDRIERRWRVLDAVRQRALLNMAFNLGETRLGAFRKMWTAIRKAIDSGGNADWWTEAAAEALDSKWAAQVGPRAQRIAAMLRTGDPA